MIPLLLELQGVVDRVEGDMAVIEWRVDAFTDLPMDLLPPGTAEGSRLAFTLDLAPDGALYALDGQQLTLGDPAPGALSIHLPPEAALRVGHHYALHAALSPTAGAPAPHSF